MYQKVALLTLAGLTMSMIPDVALAQDLTPINNFATTVRDFMTGPFARIAGAIAVAFIGYRWFTGRMELGKALTIAGGIILILGATTIVDYVGDNI